MNDELKQLIEDAAKLLGIEYSPYYGGRTDAEGFHPPFNPLDPDRGDLMKVAEAAELDIDFELEYVVYKSGLASAAFDFERNNYKSLALAILRAASVVMKARCSA